jgi:F-type H+-transporting ATPase subunit epsilon
LLSYETENGEERFLAVNEGILVKQEEKVLVSTRNAILGADLGSLRETVEQRFKVLDDRERTARSAMAKIEAGFVRRFIEINKLG